MALCLNAHCFVYSNMLGEILLISLRSSMGESVKKKKVINTESINIVCKMPLSIIPEGQPGNKEKKELRQETKFEL